MKKTKQLHNVALHYTSVYTLEYKIFYIYLHILYIYLMTMCKFSRKFTRKKKNGGANFVFLYESYRVVQLTVFAQNSHIRTPL